MVKAELKNWWREQTVHPSRAYPSMPICRCAACFNDSLPGQEVFRDPIDPRELPFKPVRKATKMTFFANAEKPKEARAKLVKKSLYKQANSSLSQKPSMDTLVSETRPLYGLASKEDRDSAETLVPTRV